MSNNSITPTPDDELARRRRRNSIALGVVLAALVAIFYILTVVKIGPGVITQREL